MKRFALAILAIAALALGTGSALAAPPTVTDGTVEFVLSATTCAYLPAGTEITGTGTSKTIESVTTDGNGVTTVTNTTHAFGTATDQEGNTYRFNYSNHYRISNTGPTDPVLSGIMVDSFSLAGNGPAHLSNGFRAVFTIDVLTGLVSYQELTTRGDPLEGCDPL